MTDIEPRDWYRALTNMQKIVFLALLSNSLTVHGRALAMDLAGPQLVQAFKGLNELQHQISNGIVYLGLGGDHGSTDALWGILQEEAAKFGLARHFRDSLQFARSRKLWEELSE